MELFKLHVENLGRIENENLSIRPLTVFVGPNNTNKTWTAYALWKLADWLSREVRYFTRPPGFDSAGISDADPQIRQIVIRAAEALRQTFNAAPNGTTVVERLDRASLLSDIHYPLWMSIGPEGLQDVIRGAPTFPPSAMVRVEIVEDWFASGSLASALFEYPKGLGPQPAGATLLDAQGKALPPEVRILEGRDESHSEDFFSRHVYTLLCACFHHVYAFPAERKTLSSESLWFQKDQGRFLSAPAAAFVRFLCYAPIPPKIAPGHSSLKDLAQLVEQRILGGKINLDRESKPGITFTDDAGNVMDVQAASSLVRALAGVVIYLKERVAPGDLIVIDEPEMNAHPEAQLAIAELLGALVNSGVNVVITTHSPYIVDHINNMVEAAHLREEKQEKIAERFKLKTKDAFVTEEKVATYEFHDDGQVTDMFERGERLIHWGTFGRVSDEVTNLYSDILDTARNG